MKKAGPRNRAGQSRVNPTGEQAAASGKRRGSRVGAAGRMDASAQPSATKAGSQRTMIVVTDSAATPRMSDRSSLNTAFSLRLDVASLFQKPPQV